MAGGVFWRCEGRLRRVWFWLVLAVIAAVAFTWSVTGSEFGSSANAAGAERVSASRASKAKPAKKVSSRPDLTAAALTARAQGSPVEVVSMRSEFTSTFANPDGTLTLKASTGQQRFRDEEGDWQSLSLEPKAQDGRLVAEDTPGNLVLSGTSKSASGKPKASSEAQARAATVADSPAADGADVVTAQAGKGQAVTVGWSGELGSPKVDGEEVTYPGSGGVDFKVSVTRSGYETFFVVKDRSAVDAAVAPSGPAKGRVAFTVPVKTKGLTAKAAKDGSVVFVDAKGKTVSRMVAPQAWDAEAEKASGLPAATTPVRMDVEQKDTGKAVVTVSIDAGWAKDAARVFPLTVDPTYAAVSVKPSFDTRVQTDGGNVDYSTDSELRVGTFNGGGVKARSYLNFPLASISGKQVVSGSLSLYNYYSYSCAARQLNVIKTGAASSATRWNNQPTHYGTSGSASFAKGYSASCPAGRQSIDVTGLVKDLAASGWVNGSVGLVAASETDSAGWKRFRSSETSDPPMLQVTYNRAPNVSAAPTFSATNTYNGVGYRQGARVEFGAVATDPDASRVKQTIEVWSATSGGSKRGECTTGLVASGARALCTPGVDLPDLASSYVRARATDEKGLSSSGWSSWTTIRRVATAPAAPTVSCPGHANGGWTDNAPSADVTCTISTSQTGMAAPIRVEVFVDGATSPTKTITVNQAAGSTTVKFPKKPDGAHEVRAVAVGPSLLTRATTHAFGWGGASLLTPAHKATTSGKVTVSGSGPPKGSAPSVSGTVRWRVAGAGDETTGWTTAANTPVTITTGSGGITKATAVWDTQSANQDAAGTVLPERTPVLLDVQICLQFGGATGASQCTWSQSPHSITRVPHAFGDGYPTADAGPGQVAQYTGEFSITDEDASIPGLASDLAIGRSHLSFVGDGTLAGWPSADPAGESVRAGVHRDLDRTGRRGNR